MSANQLISFQLITFWSYCVFQRKIDISFLGHYQANQNSDFIKHHLGSSPRSAKLASATPSVKGGLPAPLCETLCPLLIAAFLDSCDLVYLLFGLAFQLQPAL